jgi:mevalonate kinase
MEDDGEKKDFEEETGIKVEAESAVVVEEETKANTKIIEVVDEKENECQNSVKKQPKQLMRENESSDKKTNVKFDESQNIVNEFRKTDKIDRGQLSKNVKKM